MKIRSVVTSTLHFVEADGLEYVRSQFIRYGETVVTWKRNFDWKEAISGKILSNVELETLFASQFIQHFKEESENMSDVDDFTTKPLPPKSQLLKEGVPPPPRDGGDTVVKN